MVNADYSSAEGLSSPGLINLRKTRTLKRSGCQRKDSSGKVVAAWFIQDVMAAHNGKTVLSAEWGPSIAKNPFLQFTIKSGKVGDRIAISWADNRGEKRSDEATVT